jgi:general secretion pathway protein G
MTTHRTRRQGFTLIEILIVIAIISILSSVAIVGLPRIGGKGRDARRISDMRQVQTALELYFTRNGRYPTGITSWGNLETTLAGAGIGVSSIPDDPRNTGAFIYAYGSDATGSTYVIRATIEDNSNSALNDDIDGTVQGVDCGSGGAGTDGFYCVSL